MTIEDTLAPSAVVALAERIDGQVIVTDHDDYDQARRVLDTAVDCHPAAVVRPANAGDVISAVNFARELGLALAVRSGGRSPAGFRSIDTGLAIDLSSMKAIDLDLDAGTLAGHFARRCLDRGTGREPGRARRARAGGGAPAKASLRAPAYSAMDD